MTFPSIDPWFLENIRQIVEEEVAHRKGWTAQSPEGEEVGIFGPSDRDAHP